MKKKEMWSWKKESVETRNSRGETVKKEVVTVTGRSHGSGKAPKKKSGSPPSVSSQGSWKPNPSFRPLPTQASLGSPSVNPQRMVVREECRVTSKPEHQPVQPQRICYDEPMEKKLYPQVAYIEPVKPQRVYYIEPMEKKLYRQEYLGKSVDRQGYKVPELQRQNNLGRGMNDYRQNNQDRQLANFSKEDLGYIFAELIKIQQEGYGMPNFNLQNNQGRDFNGPKPDGYQAFNNAKGFEYEDVTPPEGTDDDDEDSNAEESEAEDTHSEDSDAEDTNVEDSDAEDTNIEDSDAEDSNIEDSDAEDSDDESPRSNVTDIDRRIRDLYMWRQPGRIY